MSLATTCPACGTAFRVTPDQLSAHRGDVRCGQCHHVFNALSQLIEVPAAAPPASPPQIAQAEPEVASSGGATPEEFIEETTAEEPRYFEATVILAAPEEASLADKTQAEAESEVAPEAEPEPEVPAEALSENEALQLDTENLDLELTEPELDEADSAIPVSEQAEVQMETAPVAVAPAILPEPSPQVIAFLADKPKRRVPNWLLGLFCLLLLLSLGGQTVYFMRTEIASNFPPAKPWLDRGCLLLGCVIELPRHVDMFVIEDSDLKDDADHEGVMVLTYVLFNRAPYPQAYPLLELTLTDTFDKPVLRHTFTPQEYLPKGTDVAAGIGAGNEASSQLHLSVSGDKPAGYRLWVKY